MRKKLSYQPIDGTLALIDGDILLYRIGFTTQEEPEKIALSRINTYLDEILYDSGASDYIVYLTGSENYRKTLYPEYKANRVQEKPKHFAALREYLLKYEQAEDQIGQEADDALGIKQMASNDTTIICSIDKDLHQIPGRHYNFVKKEHTIVTPEEGIYFFYQQLLTGDRVDNIPGLPKVGPVKAKKILGEMSDEDTYKDVVIRAYMEHLNLEEGLAKERINLIGKLLWIRKEEGQMWQL
jgi:DNA polymerase I